MRPALVMFIPMVAQCQWNPATNTSSTLFLYALATAETSMFCDIQATSVATCCVAHVSLVFGDWIYQTSNNPYYHWYVYYGYGHPSLIGNPLFMCMNPSLHGLMAVLQYGRPTTPCFDHEFRRSVTKLQTPSNKCRTGAPTLVWPNCDANREPNWYSPTFPNSTCGSPQFFLHHEATVSYLWLNWPLSSPRNEWKSRILIANAEIIHKDQCDPSIYIYIYLHIYIEHYISLYLYLQLCIDLYTYRFTMIYQPSSISAQ